MGSYLSVSRMSERKVLCIGLDAACFEQLAPMVDRGSLPNLEGLLDDGASGTLRTTTPPWTPSAWPSVTTGTTPWTHGIYDFYDYTGSEPHLVSATDLHAPYLWEYLSAGGDSAIVVNVPVTHPVHRFDGSLVPGYLAPEDTDIAIDGELTPQSALGEAYRIYADETDSRDARVAENEALVDARVDAAELLAERQDWSFMMVQFQRTDSIFHTLGHDRAAVRRVYERVDDAVGSLLALTDDETTVIVVSDHGIQEYERTFRCNTWLRDAGFVETAADTERYAWSEATKPDESADHARTVTDRLAATAIGALQSVGITPQRAEQALSVVGLAAPVRRLLPDKLLLDAADHVDWRASRAYCRSVSSLGLRCNVAGRDPGGVIDPAEFASVRSTLVTSLEALRAPDGTPVFEAVYDRHERHGSDVPNEASAPDIVVRPTGMRWKVTDVLREPVFGTTDEFSHTYEGLFIASGPPIRADAGGSVRAEDIAPTVLELFGYRPAPAMDGAVPTGLLDTDPERLEPPPTPEERTYLGDTGPTASETVTDRLGQLGYLE